MYNSGKRIRRQAIVVDPVPELEGQFLMKQYTDGHVMLKSIFRKTPEYKTNWE